jgi:hypothetical protein
MPAVKGIRCWTAGTGLGLIVPQSPNAVQGTGGATSRSTCRNPLYHRVANAPDQSAELRTIARQGRLSPWRGVPAGLPGLDVWGVFRRRLGARRADGRACPADWHASTYRGSHRGEPRTLGLDRGEIQRRLGWHHHLAFSLVRSFLVLERSPKRVKKTRLKFQYKRNP